jgi:hypothetical protein
MYKPIQFYLNILKTSIVSQIDIPDEYLELPEIIAILQKYNWNLRKSDREGWHTLIKYSIYSS